MLFFPSDAGGSLTLTTLASRSDTRSASGDVVRDLHRHATLTQIKRLVLPYLCRPVMVRVGAAQRPYRDIGYTEGAARWWLDGGQLRNPLAKAQEFILPQGAPLPPPFPVPAERTFVDTDARVVGVRRPAEFDHVSASRADVGPKSSSTRKRARGGSSSRE